MRFEVGRFDALRERLLAGGIAPRRVRRYLAELDDHLAELTDRERAAGYEGEYADIRARALLGSDDELAQSWLANPRLKSFTARAPWLVFGIVPPLALIMGFVIPVLLMILLARVMGLLPVHGHVGALPSWVRFLVHAVSLALNLLVGPLLVTGLSVIARRQRLSPIWPLFATGLILLLFVRLEIVFRPPGHPNQITITSYLAALITGRPRMALGDASAWQTTAQFFLTSLPMLWLMRARSRQSGSDA